MPTITRWIPRTRRSFSATGISYSCSTGHPDRSLPDYPVPVPEAGRYRVLMSTDDREFGGYGSRIDHSVKAFSFPQVCPDGATRPHILIYNLSRSALVLKRMSR